MQTDVTSRYVTHRPPPPLSSPPPLPPTSIASVWSHGIHLRNSQDARWEEFGICLSEKYLQPKSISIISVLDQAEIKFKFLSYIKSNMLGPDSLEDNLVRPNLLTESCLFCSTWISGNCFTGWTWRSLRLLITFYCDCQWVRPIRQTSIALQMYNSIHS